MAQPKHKKQSSRPKPEDIDHLVADVPVIINISHGEDVLKEYEEVIDIEFSKNTLEGRENMNRFYYLKLEQRHSTESAIFTIASEAVRDNAQQLISMLAATKNLGAAAQHELHLHIKRNGEIKCRAAVK
jgi:hypothetical protein